MAKSGLYYTILEINSICIKRSSTSLPSIWLFLDEDRISDEISFLKKLPTTKLIGVIVRSKRKNILYKKTKQISKICKIKGFKVLVASNPEIAMAAGADGVHFSKKYSNARMYKMLSYSCSFHSRLDIRRTKNLRVKKVFISPVFKTTSSNSKKPLGLRQLLFLARLLKCDIGVLGGVNKKNLRNLRNKGISHIGGMNFFST